MKDNLFDIIGIKGYCIKKDGTVWCCRKKIGLSIGGTTSVLTDEWAPIKSHQDKDGYLKVVFHNRDRQVNGAIHRLLAQVFLPNPNGLLVVCHSDGNNKNNSLANLRWDTHKGNVNDKWKHGTMIIRKGEDSSFSKLKEWQVKNIKWLLKNTRLFQREIAQMFGVGEDCVGTIARGVNWKHVLTPTELIPN